LPLPGHRSRLGFLLLFDLSARTGFNFASSGQASLTASGSEEKFTEVFYFSLSALTTIGSSGEEALTTMARQLAVVESAMGQLYLAVLISRLVGFSTTGDSKTS